MKAKVLLIITVLLLLTLIFSESLIAAEGKITVKVDSMPSVVKPGDKPITLNSKLLAKILPELKNPRLMALEDFSQPEDKDIFLEGGYAFVLTGDFNNDRVADVAFVGKYDNPDDPKYNSFLVIVSIREKKVVREFFKKVMTNQVALRKDLKFKDKTDAIVLVYNFESDECGYLYWKNKRYVYHSCLELEKNYRSIKYVRPNK